MQTTATRGKYLGSSPCTAECCAGSGTCYLSMNGLRTHARDRAAMFETIDDAREEVEYFSLHYPKYTWIIQPVDN